MTEAMIFDTLRQALWIAVVISVPAAILSALSAAARELNITPSAAEMLPDLPVRDAMQTARGLDRSVDFLETARAAF